LEKFFTDDLNNLIKNKTQKSEIDTIAEIFDGIDDIEEKKIIKKKNRSETNDNKKDIETAVKEYVVEQTTFEDFDFSNFARREHEEIRIIISKEKEKQKKIYSIILASTLAMWILLMIISANMIIIQPIVELESFQEWEIRMAENEMLNQYLDNETNIVGENNNILITQNTSASNENSSSSSSSGITGGGVSSTGMNSRSAQRALRILSAGNHPPLGSGNATLQELIENPADVSITASGLEDANNNSGLGGALSVVSLDSSASINTTAEGGNLQHQIRVDISERPTLTGDPEFVAFRSNSTINRVLIRHRSSIQYLFNNLRETNPDMAGKVIVKIVVDAFGTVLSSQIIYSTVNVPEFENKLKALILRWTFPPVDDTTLSPVTIEIPFNFLEFNE